MRHFILGVVGLVATIVAACSSDSESTGTKGTPSKENLSDASAPDVKEASTPPPAPSNPSPPPKQNTCSAQNGAEACFACCEAKSPGGAPVFDAVFRECVCKPTACAVQCAQSECSETPTDPVKGDLCSKCLEGQTECEEAADEACSENAACTALAQCIEASGCEEAGDPDGGT